MNKDGVKTTFYIQEELLAEIDTAVRGHSVIFKSRSHLICCAVVRELRRLKE